MEKKALTLAPKWTTALNVVGDNYSYQKTYDSARIYFQKALDIDSNNYGALIGMGTVYYMENNFSKAFTYYEKILNFVKRNGKTIDPWLLERLGTILKKLRRYPEAISIYESGLKIDTSDDWVFYDIVAVYALWNKPQEALQNLEEALQQGFKDWDRLNEDTDLDNIRNLPEFKALLEKYRAINK